MSRRSELETFDGLDNRREIAILLERLGTDENRARFIESLIPFSLKGFPGCPMEVQGNCDPVTAYYMFVAVCNELGVPINEGARRLEMMVRKVQNNPSGSVMDSAVYRMGRDGPVLR